MTLAAHIVVKTAVSSLIGRLVGWSCNIILSPTECTPSYLLRCVSQSGSHCAGGRVGLVVKIHLGSLSLSIPLSSSLPLSPVFATSFPLFPSFLASFFCPTPPCSSALSLSSQLLSSPLCHSRRRQPSCHRAAPPFSGMHFEQGQKCMLAHPIEHASLKQHAVPKCRSMLF